MIKFFLTLIAGILVGTLFHELYHYFAALVNNGNPHFVVGIGIGVRSTYHSSELVAFTITGFFFLLSFWLSVLSRDSRTRI